MPRGALRNRGRYLLAGLALLGGLWAWREWWGRAPARPSTHGQVSPLRPPAPHTGSSRPAVPGCFTPVQASAAPSPPAGLSGRLGLWVAEYDPASARVLRAVARDPDGLYPLASSYKQAVLWALLRAVDAGQLRLNERFDVTRGSQSLGDYPFDGSDVRSLMARMIHNSDNTATDILHRRVGLEAVQAVADRLGLCRTRLILPTKDWWVAQGGLDPAFPGAQSFMTADPAGRDRIARQLDNAARGLRADTVQRHLDDYLEHRYDPAADLGTHNVSTPAEFGQLIAQEFLKPGLSAQSRAIQREVMATGFGRTRLDFKTAEFGGKGGNGWRILTMTGYAVTPDGHHLVYVFMQHGADQTYTLPKNRLAFRWVNAAVQDLLRGAHEQAAAKPAAPSTP